MGEGSGRRRWKGHGGVSPSTHHVINCDISYAATKSVESGTVSLRDLQRAEPLRFPIELAREDGSWWCSPPPPSSSSHDPSLLFSPEDVDAQSRVLNSEFPTSHLLRELHDRYEEYDARFDRDRQAWLKSKGFSAGFELKEPPDEVERRMRRRDAQVLAEISMATLPRLKAKWEGFGTGFQSSEAMLRGGWSSQNGPRGQSASHLRQVELFDEPEPLGLAAPPTTSKVAAGSAGIGTSTLPSHPPSALALRPRSSRVATAPTGAVRPPRKALLGELPERMRVVPKRIL
jgi:hypothetical protein